MYTHVGVLIPKANNKKTGMGDDVWQDGYSYDIQVQILYLNSHVLLKVKEDNFTGE